ncbi:MFS general substrate transporter [Aspergillus eucalypticola CBS 122712]|uniref:MFS general substrate transporter n=1 Tax=Aspergillus eucalypticola (strain CBS 122712 / IBT 29274) TaxID=1448314 RepID=A0A317V0L1_ASPEC|nr:MFS general substrate transporter [Aspergillus eucalypticola CBS 122712]PWY67864.1 MFS general substrate transporter [Aspergillus eucalypticola CBS 122712]
MSHHQRSPSEEVSMTALAKPASESTIVGDGHHPLPAKDTSTRAWLVVVGGLLIYFPTFGFLNAFGTFQTFYVQDLLAGTSSSKIAWIGSLQIFLLFIGGLVVGPLYDKVGATKLLVPGSVVYVVALMLTSVCKKYYQLILAQGILFGCANALLFYPTIAAINQWFDRRRGIALGLAVSGSSLGGIFWTEIIQLMLDHIGFGWTVRACGFISLAFLVPSCVLIITRPPEPGESKDMQLDFKAIFTDAKYLLFSVGMLLVLWGMFIPFFYLPSYGETYGMSVTGANNLLAYMNAGSFVGRVLTGLMADRLGRFNIISLAALSCGILLFCLHKITTSGAIIAFSTLYGICSGGLISLQSACIGQITPDHSIIGVKIGLMMGFCSVGGLTGSPIAGALLSADHQKWYGFIDFCGSILMGGAVVTILSRYVAAPREWKF